MKRQLHRIPENTPTCAKAEDCSLTIKTTGRGKTVVAACVDCDFTSYLKAINHAPGGLRGRSMHGDAATVYGEFEGSLPNGLALNEVSICLRAVLFAPDQSQHLLSKPEI